MTVSAKILAEYGIDPSTLPEVKVIPRGVSGLPDPSEKGMPWKEARAMRQRIYLRQERFRRANMGLLKKEADPAPEENTDDPVIEKKVSKPVQVRKAPKPASTPRQSSDGARVGVLQECVEAGMTAKQIADRLGLCRKTVQNNLSKLGLRVKNAERPKPPRPPVKDNSDLIQRIRELAVLGHNGQAIAEMTGRDRTSIARLAKANSIVLSKKHRRLKPREINVDADAIIKAYESGMSVLQVSRHVHHAIKIVRGVLNEAGIEREYTTIEARRRRKIVAEAHARGLYSTAICKETGFSASSVSRALSACGLEPHPAPRSKIGDETVADAIVRLHKEGRKSTEIADLVSKSKSHVNRVLQARLEA